MNPNGAKYNDDTKWLVNLPPPSVDHQTLTREASNSTRLKSPVSFDELVNQIEAEERFIAEVEAEIEELDSAE